MSRKSSWWLRPQRKGASNRAALNESKYFMEHNKVLRERINELAAENAKLLELVRGLHMAYVGALNECESMDAGLIWDHCEMVDAELAKSHAKFEVDRHRFDVAMRELGVEVDDA